MSYKYPQKAVDASYNNVRTGIAARNVQDALDEIGGIAWTTWTPTGSWSNNMTYAGRYRVSRGVLECRVELTFTGAPSGGNLEIDFPPGWEADPAAFTRLSTQNNPLGNGLHIDFSNTRDYDVMVHAVGNDPDRVRVRYKTSHATGIILANVTPTAPFTVANTHFSILTWRVPVVVE